MEFYQNGFICVVVVVATTEKKKQRGEESQSVSQSVVLCGSVLCATETSTGPWSTESLSSRS